MDIFELKLWILTFLKSNSDIQISAFQSFSSTSRVPVGAKIRATDLANKTYSVDCSNFHLTKALLVLFVGTCLLFGSFWQFLVLLLLVCCICWFVFWRHIGRRKRKTRKTSYTSCQGDILILCTLQNIIFVVHFTNTKVHKICSQSEIWWLNVNRHVYNMRTVASVSVMCMVTWCTWYMVHGAWCMAHGTWWWYMVHGAWYMVHGTWCMVHGGGTLWWYMVVVHGTWYMEHST